ncbi:MAG TPA: AsmA-like C-terminal domain-containing protein [Candidatus Saccharimonadales bacterium]|nr:AsmA-like C-terminal domain-containing protein [Candidatus Saccharimonadales bacterium]
MRKVFKFIGVASVTLVLFFIVASLAFYHLIRIGEFRRFLVAEIEKNTDLKVELGEADLEIGWVTGVVFRQVALSEAGAAQPAITAESVTARVALRPLLQRKIIFYEIRLQRPVARFVADPEGRIVLLDKLLNLPFLKQHTSEIELDLRALRIQSGAIEFTDERAAAAVGRWRLVDASVNLERVRGQRLRDFMKDLLRQSVADSPGEALEFSFRGAVENDLGKMTMRADGRLLFPKNVLEFQQARWIADVELVDIPAALVKQFAARRAPIKSMTGYFAQRLHLDGNANREIRLKGDLDFRQLGIEAPELLLAPLSGADGRSSFELDWTRQRVQLRRVEFRTNDMKFLLQGEVRALDSDDPHLNLTVSGLSAPLPVLRKYLPVKIGQSPRLERALDSIQSGQVVIKKAGVNASVGELRHLAETGVGKQVWFDAEIRDVAGNLAIDNTLPLRAVQGRVKLENALVSFADIRGNYGDSHLTDLDGNYDLAPAGGGKMEVRAIGDFNLAELQDQLRLGLLPAGAKLVSSVQELGGRGKADLTIKSIPNTPLQFDGKVALDNARLRYEEYSLSEIKGDLQFSPKEIKGGKIQAQLRGSPVQIQVALNDYTSDDGGFDLTVESTGMRAGVITSLLLDTGSLQDPGVVRGSVRYRGPLRRNENRRLTGDLDLINVQLNIHPLLQPLRELNGRIKIDEAGIDFQSLKALLVGSPASASGRWRYKEKPQLLFDFAAPTLDVTYLISQIDPEASDFYAKLQALGRITIGKGRLKNFEFSDLQTDTTIDHRVWRLTNLAAQSAGGSINGITTIFDRPDTLELVAEPKIQATPTQSFLKWFDITNTEMTGRVNLTGKLETVGKNDRERKRNLNGAFNLRIEDGTINRMRILVQILNLLDLSRWFTLQLPDLTKQGIRFRTVTGDFKVSQGIYATENLVVDSNDLRMTGVGKIDVPKDELDFVVAVRPFAGIDSAINQIPILGWGIAAIKNSFLVASFNITGRIDDPTITPAPLGTLSEMFWGVLGIPKSILGVGEGDKKDVPKEPIKTPAQ